MPFRVVLIAALALAAATLACSPTGAAPTATLVPPTPAPPTNTPEPPTAVPTEERPSGKPTPGESGGTDGTDGTGGQGGLSATAITAANAADLEERWYVTASETALTAAAASTASHDLASFGYDKIIRIWDGDTGDLLGELAPHADYGFGLAYSPDGSMLASGGGFEVRIWDALDGDMLTSVTVNSFVYKTVWAPDNSALAVVGQNSSRIDVIDPATGEYQFEIPSDGIILWSVAFSPDGRYLATGNANGDVRVFDLNADGAEVLFDNYTANGSMNDLEFSPDNGSLAGCTTDGSAYVWETGSWSVVLPGDGIHAGGCNDGAYSADGSVYFTVGADGYFNAWDAVNGGDALNSFTTGVPIWGVSVTGDGELVAMALDDGDFVVFGLP
jgi:WD40 repeat protein